MKRPDVEHLMELSKKASPLPWYGGRTDGVIGGVRRQQFCVRVRGVKGGQKVGALCGFVDDGGNFLQSVADTEFIATTRSAIPELCNYALHLEAENKKLRAQLYDAGLPDEPLGIPHQFGGPL